MKQRCQGYWICVQHKKLTSTSNSLDTYKTFEMDQKLKHIFENNKASGKHSMTLVRANTSRAHAHICTHIAMKMENFIFIKIKTLPSSPLRKK